MRLTNAQMDEMLATATRPYENLLEDCRAENKRLREAFEQYADHDNSCPRFLRGVTLTCVCGFDAALAEKG